jgi:hypothetical protein
MEDLKNKLLEHGIYGIKLSEFTSEEIDYLYNKDYVEIYYSQDKNSLKTDLLGESITKLKDYKIIKDNIDLLNIRINYNVFKDYLRKYKFKGDFPYQVIDILLTSSDYLKSTDIKQRLNSDSKKIFYVTKKLNEHESLLHKRENNFTLLKIKKEGLFESDYCKEQVFNLPDVPSCLKMDISLLDQIKSMIRESQIGITTEDLNKQFGISVRQALHYLNKISDLEKNKYKHKEIFIGKVKRLLFYLEEDSVKRKQLESSNDGALDYVTSADRLNALNKMLEHKKGFVISEESILQFRLFLNTKFTPCKKTLMSTALKGGHKIFILKEKSDSKTLIIDKDVSIASYLNDTEEKTPKFKNTIEEGFYNKFVMNINYIIQDNFYKNKENLRVEVLYEYLLSKSKEGLLLIDKNFIMDMNLKLLFQIVPIEIPNVVYEIVEQKNLLEGITSAKINLEDLGHITRKDLFSKKFCGRHSKILKIQLMYKRIVKIILELEEKGLIEKYLKNVNNLEANLENVNNLETNLEANLENVNNLETNLEANLENNADLDKLDLTQFTLNTDLKILGRNTDKNLIKKILNEQILIKLVGDYKEVCEDISKKTKKNIYINYEDRIKLFNIVRSNTHGKAYKIVKKYIKKKYSDTYKHIMKIIDNIFIDVQEEEEVYLKNPNIQEFLYTKIKHDLLKNNNLDPKDFVKYDCVDSVLEKLRKDEVITAHDKQTTLTNCSLRSKIRSRLERRFEIVDSKYKMYSDRDTIYNIYFNFFYEILVKKGSLELSDILTKINICKDFEFYNFVKAYKDVFEVNDVEGTKIVSVKIDIDPFDFI